VVPPVNLPVEPGRASDDFRVAFGDSLDRVKAVYSINSDPISSGSSLMLNLPLSGIRFFFSTGDKTLNNIRVDAPYAGRVEGIRIGDPLKDILSRFGEPYAKPWDFGGNKAYIYRLGGRLVLPCELNRDPL
jgi:hypothetical protein